MSIDLIKKFGSKTGKLHWFHWAIISLSLVLTFGAWYFAKTQIEEKNHFRFDREAEQVIALIKERMGKYEEALWAGVAAINSQSHGMDSEEWRRFSQTLKIHKRYPGINGIGVIHYVLPEKLESFLENERKLRPNFKIHPKHENNEFWPITYVEPAEKNAAAIGLDMAHENNRFTAGKKARDSGLAQITAPITLVQDAAKTPGFLFYVPYYDKGEYDSVEERQEHFLGMVYAPFIFNKLTEGTLGKDNRQLGIKISDGKDILYNEHLQSEEDFDPNPAYTKTSIVNFYGRDWVFDMRAAKSFKIATSNDQPIIILIGGLIIDSLLIGLFMLLSRSNQRAVVLAEDMTKELKESENKLSSIVKNAVDGLITIDEMGIVESYNPACEKMFGYTAEEIIGQNVKILMPKLYQSETDSYLGNHEDSGDESSAKEINGKRKDGSIFPIDLSINEVIIDDKKIYSGIVRDISARKKIDAEQEKLIAKLVDSNTELERFAFVCSHDLQEPLRMVRSFSEKLKLHIGDSLEKDEKGKRYFRFVTDGAARAQNLITDILAYSSLDNDTQMREEFSADLIIEVIKENMLPNLEKSGGKITHDTLPMLQGNKTQIYQLFQNLINNGLKYQAPDVVPHVHVGCEDKQDYWQFSIKDNGIGIEQRHLTKIFDVFLRLHSKNQYAGTGVGLSICKKVVERHDGKIWVESENNAGSTFYFTLLKPNN